MSKHIKESDEKLDNVLDAYKTIQNDSKENCFLKKEKD